MVNKTDYVYETSGINMNITYGEWYVMRFIVYNGFVKAFVNDIRVYVSNSSFPIGEYHEPI